METKRPEREEERGGAPRIRYCESRPGRTVFTEEGNTEGWIATDLAVELPR